MAQPNTPLTLGSLFAGSGGFELGGILAGIQPIWNCEIEPFPIRVTTKRLPQVKHYGDISALDGAELEPVDIITGGFPCQSVSIAGKREGVQHIDHGGEKTTRSGLFYEAVRIIKEMRKATNGEKPRYFVVENVPGLFSSKAGEDFKSVLEEIIGIVEPSAEVPAPDKKGWPDADYYVGDGWSVAYRVFDAQWWGVPQRRKRIYLVADFAGQSAPKVLFESEGVSGYSAAGFRAWQRTASGAESGTGTAGGNGTVGSGGTVRRGGGIVLNDQGGACMDVSEEVTGTLRAQEHGHPPCVLEAAGFCTEHSANARSVGFEEERSPTLRAGVVPAAIALENYPTDSRVRIAEDGMVQTLPARMGTGGGNVPLLMEAEKEEANVPVTLKIRSGCSGGGKGPIWQEDKSATLGCNNDQTLFVPEPKANMEPKAYGICSKASYSMLSDNPHSGFYEAEVSRTLDCNGGNPTCAQGGVCICQPAVYCMTTGEYTQVVEEKAPTLMARDYKDPPLVARDKIPVCMATGQSHAEVGDELCPTLNCNHEAPVLADPDDPFYIVRRLTPTECARLQGFPDWWCSNLGIGNPTPEDIAFWSEVWETHRKVMGTSQKPKSEKQIIKWLKNPYSESAEYRLWGNGVALPCVYFALAGIVYAHGITVESE